MKQSPSERQFEYLRSIGAWNDGHPAIIPVPEHRSHISMREIVSRIKWWWFALLCGALIAVIATAAYADDVATGATDRSVRTTDDVTVTAGLGLADTNNITISTSSTNAGATAILANDTVVIVATVLFVFGAGLAMAWWMLKRLITAIQRIAISVTPFSMRQSRTNSTLLHPSTIPKEHIRRLPHSDIPTPEQVIQALSDFAQGSPLISHTPSIPRWSWSLGFSTQTGNVRKENQDYVSCFRVENYDVLICADGLGGLPKGQQASFLAVFEAAKSIVQQLGSKPSWRSVRLEKVLRIALSQAQHILSAHGDKLRITDINGGLRTTIILVLAKDTEVHYGYIGDGALEILRTSGQMESLMIPQKHGHLPNVLSASLGPQRQGEAVIGQVKRAPGDLLIVSTDGIADRVDAPAFARDIMRTAIHNNGDLHAVAQQVVEELANSKDDYGYICDDNLTLALLGTGQAPLLGSGFWNEPASDEKTDGSDDPNGEKADLKQPAVEGTSS